MKPSGPGLLFVGTFWSLLQSHWAYSLYSDSLILPDLVLEDCMFLRIYPLHLGCPVCPHIIVYIFLQSFVFLWCQLLFPLFHFWFYLFGSFVFFSLMSLIKGLSILFIFSNIQLLDSLILCMVFFRLYFIYFCSDLYYFLPPIHFGLSLLFFFKFLWGWN